MRQPVRINDSDFSLFYSPFNAEEDHISILIKSDEKDPYTIYLEASNESTDTQKDVLFMRALEEEAENFLKNGLISWDHLHKIKNDPAYIIGEPLDVKFDKNAKRTFVKGKLYKGVDYAESVVKLVLAKSKRLGASVGGFIKKKKQLSKSIKGILKVIWDELAITYKPVNSLTTGNVSMIPIGAFAKALAVGSGVNPASFSSGRTMVPESLQGTSVNLKEISEELMWRIKSQDIITSDDLRDFLELKGIPSTYGQFARVLTNKYSR